MQIGLLGVSAVASQQDLGSAQSGTAGQMGRGSTDTFPPLSSKTDFQLRARLLVKSAPTPSQSSAGTPSYETDQSPTFTVRADVAERRSSDTDAHATAVADELERSVGWGAAQAPTRIPMKGSTRPSA